MIRDMFIDHYKDTDVQAENICKAQEIARDCLSHMSGFLRPGMKREEIHRECERYMREKGSERWWIHNDPALILFGDLSTYSGREDPSFLFAGKTVKEDDLITIDVAPTIGNGWGDMARSFIMEDGRIIPWQYSRNREIIEGMELELKLHQLFIDSISQDLTFSMLHRIVNDRIAKEGWYNCDYHGNFGHTIENHPDDRVTIADGVDIRIVEYDKPITFEPHICKINGSSGIKYENMYFFHDGKMEEVL